jgi:PAS domain S-box-containing protein
VLTPFQKEAIAYTNVNPKGVYVRRDTKDGKEVLKVATADTMSEQACVTCHNSHPDRTWSQNKWRLGDSRGVLETTLPIESEISAIEHLRRYLIGFITLIFLLVFYYLYRVLKSREKELTNVADELEAEVDTLNALIDEHALISKTDLQGRITYASKEFARLSGYTQEELIGRPHSIVRHPDVSESVYRDLWNTVEAGNLWSGDLQNLAKDGSTYYVHARIFPVYDTHQKKVGYAAIRNDITERILSQQALNQTRKLHQVVTDNQHSILVMTNDDEGVVSFNKRFFEIFAYKDLQEFKSKHECICELFIEKEGYISPEHKMGQWVQVILADHSKVHKVLMKNREGEERIFSVLLKAVELDSENFYVSTLTDITDLERAREAAESSEKAKSEFMANISHELRTPLNGIHGFTELLEKTPLDTTQVKYVSIIKSSMKNLLQIVNDVLDFSKIQSGKMGLNKEKINPFVDLKEALELFSSICQTKNIAYVVKIDSKISEFIVLDKLRLVQVLNNLINNAVKFTPDGGTITVDMTLVKKRGRVQSIRFGVRDTGIGISKKNQKKIFEVFTQADSSTTKEFGGTGLGLSISASLVELLGGKLRLKSEENTGSYFFFELDVDISKNSDNDKTISAIENQPIYVIGSEVEKESIGKVVKQLQHFQVEFQVIDKKEENIEVIPEVLYVVFNLHDMHRYSNGLNRMILIYSEEIESVLPSNIYHISTFDAFPSKLYNAIMELDSVQFESLQKRADIEREHIDLKVLIVEDYIPNQILMEELLLQYGIKPDIANNGKEAVEQAKGDYDIILMDINMPEMNGIEATQLIRESGTNVIIIALTANALEGDKERFLKEGMDGYLSKPVEIEKLYKVLKKYENRETK